PYGQVMTNDKVEIMCEVFSFVIYVSRCYADNLCCPENCAKWL
ncbi:unnamed protein product, partial [marine sediment metagenome]